MSPKSPSTFLQQAKTPLISLSIELAASAAALGRQWALAERQRRVERGEELPYSWPFEQRDAMDRVLEMSRNPLVLDLLAAAVHEAAVLAWPEATFTSR